MTIDRAMKEAPELRDVYEQDTQVRQPDRPARRSLEGVARNASTHAAGVVISTEPLVEHLPLARPARGDAAGDADDAVRDGERRRPSA